MLKKLGFWVGITLDELLDWKAHMIDMYMYVLNRLVNTMSKEIALMAYHGYVLSSMFIYVNINLRTFKNV